MKYLFYIYLYMKYFKHNFQIIIIINNLSIYLYRHCIEAMVLLNFHNT
jgi:hypothetical protein